MKAKDAKCYKKGGIAKAIKAKAVKATKPAKPAKVKSSSGHGLMKSSPEFVMKTKTGK